MRRMLLPVEVSRELRISVARVYDLTRRGVLPSVRIGRQVRIPEDGLRAWVERGGAPLAGGWRREPGDEALARANVAPTTKKERGGHRALASRLAGLTSLIDRRFSTAEQVEAGYYRYGHLTLVQIERAFYEVRALAAKLEFLAVRIDAIRERKAKGR